MASHRKPAILRKTLVEGGGVQECRDLVKSTQTFSAILHYRDTSLCRPDGRSIAAL
jgi:hypothetical protein